LFTNSTTYMSLHFFPTRRASDLSDMVEVKRGETAKLVCEVHGAKPVSIKWLRQNVRTGKYEELNLDYVPEAFTYPRYTALEKNLDRKSTRLNSSHVSISYAVFCL